MSRLYVIRRVIVPWLFACTLSAIAASTDENIVRVRFPMDERFMVIVPVSINGAGPFNFMLDTGNNTTIIDRKLADQLSLPLVGEKEVTGIEVKLDVLIAHSRSISIAGRTVNNLNVNVLPGPHRLPNVRGVLGEDFLSHFDLLIDNRHHVIELQLGLGPMSEMFKGEHLAVTLEGNIDGETINHRLIVTGYSVELGNRSISLQLDSAANFLYLFGGAETLGAGTTMERCVAATISNRSYRFLSYKKKIWQLNFGQKKITNMTAYSLPQASKKDTEGLMPTSAFRSIFISHSQKFVILDPSRKM
jgi:predicted aspartyl protease